MIDRPMIKCMLDCHGDIYIIFSNLFHIIPLNVLYFKIYPIFILTFEILFYFCLFLCVRFLLARHTKWDSAYFNIWISFDVSMSLDAQISLTEISSVQFSRDAIKCEKCLYLIIHRGNFALSLTNRSWLIWRKKTNLRKIPYRN